MKKKLTFLYNWSGPVSKLWYKNICSRKRFTYLCGRGTPIQMMKYKHSLLLFKLYNDTLQSEDWMDLNWNQSFNNRSTKVRLFDTSNIRIGKNILSNRLTIVNSQIEYDWLNKSLNSYKLICKLLFLS